MMIDNNFYIAVFLCVIIIIYAFYQSVRLGKAVNHILFKIRAKSIQSYLDYDKSLIVADREMLAFQKAEDLINLDNLFKHESINIRHYLAIPSQLIGAGVLFTFLGLTMGLWGFDMDQLEDSIKNFITALSIKFLTSIAGMSSAIIFNFFEKYKFHQLEVEINKLCLELDNAYYQPYGRYFERCLFQPFVNQQKQQLAEIASRIQLNFAELKKVNEDTAAIKGGMAQLTENIARNIEKSFEAINGQIAKHNTQQFEALRESSEHSLSLLQTLFEKSSSKLNEQLERWNGYLKVQDEVISQSTQSIEALPATVLGNLTQIKTAADEINTKISNYSDHWTNAVSLQKVTVNKISKVLKETIPDLVRLMDNTHDTLKIESTAFKQQVGQYNAIMKTGLSAIDSHIGELNHAVEKSTQSSGGFDMAIQNLTTALTRLESHATTIDTLNGYIEAVDTDVKAINTGLKDYHSELKQCREAFVKNAGALELVIKRMGVTDKVYFTFAPNSDSCFDTKDFSEQMTRDVLYKISFASNDSVAGFEFINQPDIVNSAIRYPEDMLYRACENENAFNRDATRIITVQKGEAVRQGDRWRITQKAKIRYEVNAKF